MEVISIENAELVQTAAQKTQVGLNEVLMRKVNAMLARKTDSVQATIARMEAEGKLMQDYLAPIGVNLKEAGSRPVVTFSSNGAVNMDFGQGLQRNHFSLHDNAVGQLATKMNIPTRYLRNLASGTEWEKQLAAHILNEHSGNTERSRVLIRTVGNQVRGVLSDSYKRLNSQQILEAFITEAISYEASIADALYTDTKLYVETILPTPIVINTRKNGEIVMFAGARLSTSDFGDGALDMRAFLLNGACLNGMVRESLHRQVHLGGKLQDGISFSDETYKKDSETTVSAIRDLTRMLYDKEAIMEKAMEINKACEVEVDLNKELKGLLKAASLQKAEVECVEKILMANNPNDGVQGESTLWKLTQAITAHARNLAEAPEPQPRRARELQELCGSLLQRVHA